MKISKFMLLGGAFTLVVGSLFATKASKKFAAVSTAYAGGSFLRAPLLFPSHLTSAVNTGHTLFIATAAEARKGTLFTATTGVNKVYYK